MNAPDQARQYDRTTQTVGNIVHLEHYNCVIDDQRLATLFYVVGLGGTRDPYIFMGLENMWVNFGRTQVHLPSRGPKPRPEVLRGTAGFVVPDLGDAEEESRVRRQGNEARRAGAQHAVFLAGQGRRRGGDLPVGQPHPLPRAFARVRAAPSSASSTSISTSRPAPPRASRASTARS